MRIMFLAQCYAPESVSAAVLITELATDLAKHGHDITVVTGAPSYPYGIVYEGYRNRLYDVEVLNGVRVIRTWSYISPSKAIWSRLFHQGTYSAMAFLGALAGGRPDLLVSFSPPLPLGLSAWLLSCLWRRPWVLQLEDLYPEAAVAAGVLKNKRVIDFFLGIEQFLYRHAQRISVISAEFERSLLAKGIAGAKIRLIPPWADPNEVWPMQKDNEFRRCHGLDDKFVVMYAGNLGLTSCLEDVVLAAEILRNRKDIEFVIVGEGVKRETLEAEAREKNLRNMLFLPYQPRELMSEMLAAADVGLVTLNTDAMLSSLPHKVFDIMASARPVLGVTPPEGETARLIRTAGCGWNVPPSSPRELAGTIIELNAHRALLPQMGQNGRCYVERNHSRSRCIDAYEAMLKILCDPGSLDASPIKGVS